MYYDEDVRTRDEKVRDKENLVFETLQMMIRKNGRSPSILELTRATGIKSKATTLEYLRRLRDKGLIKWEPKRHRTITITEQRQQA